MKACTKCGEVKDLTLFYRDARKLDGRQAQCKSCADIANKHYYYKDGLKTNTRQLSLKKTQLKRLYGCTIEDVYTMHKQQNGKCAICDKEIIVIGNSLTKYQVACVDHNHVTGKIRGLLCNTCNRGLGFFKDSTEIVRKAFMYMENTND